MRILFYTSLTLLLAASLCGKEVDAQVVIDRARATVGTEAALNSVVTLQIVGHIEPVDPALPPVILSIIARKPTSQRMEIRVDDIVETTILDGDKGCIIRTNLEGGERGASQMRDLVQVELERVIYNTRQLFNYYRPDFKNGEKVSLRGTETYRGQRCYKLHYEYPNGLSTIRYFSVSDDTLVATITESGLESVIVGAQTVTGIQFPEEIEYYEGERKLHTMILNELKVNKPLTAGIFDIPEGDTQ